MLNDQYRNLLSVILVIGSVLLLIPGLFTDILTIKVSMDMAFLGNKELHRETQSIIGSIGKLWEDKNYTVSMLILFFSVIVPVLKAVIMLIVLLMKKLPRRYSLYRFVFAIGKWSMADVFVVGVLIAWMSTRSMGEVDAQLHEGFYYFASYCIISLLAVQVASIPKNPEHGKTETEIEENLS